MPEGSGEPFTGSEIAIVGMAGRFPRARNLAEHWANLCGGVECISFFSEEELRAAGISARLLARPNFVPARGVLADLELFDAAFFGFTPREAEITDPQHRHFLECAWEALEAAGYGSEKSRGPVGVFAGCSLNTYLFLVAENEELAERLGQVRIVLGNDKDFLPTWLSYKLNLKGPSLAIQTACSTSLVAVHVACQSLLNGECDLAVAGGASVTPMKAGGYLYQEGGISSPDGHCRAFDAQAAGTVHGDGVGVVVLRRLEDAMASGDPIRAVIRGSAINNDGSNKIGFTAPSVEGQARAITEALNVAGIDPETVTCLEAHGTGTALGDPIEIEALTKAFRTKTAKRGFCALGSVKTNIGHLDAAAGVAGLIKTVLALENGLIPPSLHFERPNPAIDFAATPFYVNTQLRPWKSEGGPRRAGVSSFGLGGTNAHVVVEEAPPPVPSGPSRPLQLLVLSAKTERALETLTADLSAHLGRHPAAPLADVAHTLMVGRWAFKHRRFLVCGDAAEAAAALIDPRRTRTAVEPPGHRTVAFLFPGQGSQHPGMAAGLYRHEPVFRRELDRSAEILAAQIGCDLRRLLDPPEGDRDAAARQLEQTAFAQPALFAVEHALARLWIEWGVTPRALLGHSVGELVAACLAGVFSLEDALRLVAERGRLMQSLPPGGMVAVPLSEADVAELLDERLSLAAVNAPQRSVVSGPEEALADFERRLAGKGLSSRRLRTSHAFHSAAMKPAVQAFSERVSKVALAEPAIPFLSNVTGTWITSSEARSPAYWGRQMLATVRFGDGVAELLRTKGRLLLEVGPGQALGALARQQPAAGEAAAILSSLPAASESGADLARVLTTLGELWLHGVDPDWTGFYRQESRRRIPLPTYPFERQRYWILPEAVPVRSEQELAMSEDQAIPSPSPQRHATILAALRDIIRDLVGGDGSQIDSQANFLELGVDSLLLIQASQLIQARFDVPLSLIQLLEELQTLDKLAAHINLHLPAPAEPPPPPALPALPEPSPVRAAPVSEPPAEVAFVRSPAPAPVEIAQGDGALAALLSQQLQAMTQLVSQQLQLLGGGRLPEPGAAAPPPVAAIAPPVTSTTPLRTPPVPAGAPPGQGAKKPFVPYEPIQLALSGDLSARQRHHLESFIERYTKRTAESKRLTQRYRRFLADTRGSKDFRLAWKEMIYPILGGRSAGSRLWDVDGNEYVDISMGFGLHLFGHSPQFLIEALEKQLREDLAVGPQSTLAGYAAELIAEMTGLERVVFCNSGTEAVMAALRAARTYAGRDKIALFRGSYHGWSDVVLVRGVENDGRLTALPSAPGISANAIKDVLLLDYGDPESLKVLAGELDQLAAVLVEPVQSRRPDLQPRAFLQELRELTSRSKTALIFDEMVSGFRAHPGGAQAWFGVQADLAIYGKVLSNGLPLGVVAGQAPYMDVFDGGMWQYGDRSYPSSQKTLVAGAYFKNPLTMAAAVASLEELKRQGPQLQADLNARTERLVGAANEFFRQERVPIEVSHYSSLFRFQTLEDHEVNQLFFFHLTDKGVFYTRETGNCFLSTAHSDADEEFILGAIRRTVSEMREGGYFPERPSGPGRDTGGAAARTDRPPAAPVRVSPPVSSAPSARAQATTGAAVRPLEFSLYYFGTYDREYRRDKYDLLLDGARFADRHGFSGIWLPERHFYPVGGLSPNPSVLAAALARETRNVELRAGSVVLPLHNPIRVAEEWALVDNLSGGRAGLAIASGWHPDDFVFAPEAFGDRREIMYRDIETIRRLWRGEPVPARNGAGADLEVRLFPLPSRPELPIWVTAASRSTYERAGTIGAGVLTNLFEQSLEDLEENLAIYRAALARHGFPPESARVTVLLHTFVDPDEQRSRDIARGPLCHYLKSSLGLLGRMLRDDGKKIDLSRVSEPELDYLISKAFDRWIQSSALVGGPETCARLLDRLAATGVTEVGCFIDFGIEPQQVLEGLVHLEQLTERYRRRLAAPAAAAPPPTPRRVPVSEVALYLWALAQLGPEAAAACVESLGLRMRGLLRVSALRASLQSLVDRYEAFRLSYGPEGDYLEIAPAMRAEMPIVDLSALPPGRREEEASSWALREVQRPMDLVRGPLARFYLWRLDGDLHLLLIALHHLLSDGRSQAVLMGELRQVYEAACRGTAPGLPAPMAFGEEAEKRSPADQEALKRAEAYWLRVFADGIPTLDLPTDFPRPPVQTYRVDRFEAGIAGELLQKIRKVSAQSGATSFMTLLAGVNLWLHSLCGQRDLVVGINAIQPDGVGAAPAIELRTNPLALRSRLEGDPSFREYLGQVKRSVLEGFAHQTYPIARLVRQLKIRRTPDRPPVAPFVLNLDHASSQTDLFELEAEVVGYPSGVRSDIFLNISERPQELWLYWDYNSALFRRETLERWMGQLQATLEAIAAHPDLPVSSLLAPAQPLRRTAPEARAHGFERRDLTRFQQLFWVGQRLHPEALYFQIPTLHRIPARLDPRCFREAWEALVSRSDALRTVFAEVEGVPEQRVLPALPGDLPTIDLSRSADPWAEAQRCARALAGRALRLEERSWDTCLMRLAEDRFAWYCNLHHLIADGWSTSLVFRLMGELYALAEQGRLAEAPALPPFSSYVEKERQYLESQDSRPAAEYWQTKLAHEPEPIPFFGKTARRHSTETQRRTLDLGRERSERLARFAALSGRGARSLSHVFTALVAALIYRISGKGDLSLGLPLHNRGTSRFKETIGPFLVMAPLHIQVEADDRLATLIAKVAAENREILRHREYPVGNPAQKPSYEVECNFINVDFASFAGVPTEMLWIHSGQGQESLAVHARDFGGEGRLAVDFDFHCGLFDEGQQERTLACFLRLADAWLDRPDQPLGDIPLLSGEELSFLVQELNQTGAPLPEEQTFRDLFALQVERGPGRLAITAGDGVLTYGELDERASALARRLGAFGVGPEVVVGVLARRGTELLTALVAVLKAGGVYLPLDLQAPPLRLEQMVLGSRTAVLLTGGELSSRASEILHGMPSGQRPAVLEIGSPAAEPFAAAPSPRLDLAHLAYVLYTSGSTGTPKGAMVEHRGMLNHLLAKVADLELAADDVVAQNASQAFDISIWQFLAPLLVGASVAVVGDEEARDPGALLALVRRRGVTVLEMVPALLRALLGETEADGAELPLRCLLSTGEPLPADLWRDWLQRCPQARLLNAYGPTECSDDVTHGWLDRPPGPEATYAPVGRPIANTRIYLLERYIPVPYGLPAELCVAGDGVGRGYLADPARTAEVYVPDPFSPRPGGRMYRTGDLARYGEGGQIELLGRLDHQVKVRGFRIELGEIEAALREHPGVGDAVVLARSEEGGGKLLVAYVVPESAPAPGELRDFLQRRLPDFMVPAAFVHLEALPLTLNGKVDRRALPAPDPARPGIDSPHVAPRDEREARLAAIWAEVLGIERVGVLDDFFELGGDSILALQIVAKANRSGFRLSPMHLFQRPTVAALAALSDGSPAIAAEQGPVVGEAPLTPVQSWFFALEAPEPHHWNQSLLLEVREPLEPPVLGAAVQALLAQHDALRARFERQGPRWHQKLAAPGGELPLTRIDLSAVPRGRWRLALGDAAEQVQASLDLSHGPMLRFAHFVTGKDRAERLLIAIHHLVVDGVSWRVLLEDLETACRQLARSEPPKLPPKTTSFLAWAEQLDEHAGSAVVQTDALYWLTGPWQEARPLPVDFPGGENTTASNASVDVALEAAETRSLLQELPQAYGVRIDALLLTALARVLADWTGSDTCLVELEGHGREDLAAELDLSRTVGWFTVMYPVLLAPNRHARPAEAVRETAAQLARVPSRGLAYGLLRSHGDSVMGRRLEEVPRPEIGFNYLGQFDPMFRSSTLFELARESAGRTHSPRGPRTHLVDVNGLVTEGRLQFAWSYSRNLHRPATVRKLAAAYLRALRELLAEAERESVPAVRTSDFGWSPGDLEAIRGAIQTTGGRNLRPLEEET